jgi:Sigma-70, region 4.
MTAKEYLQQIRIKGTVISQLQKEREELRQTLFSLGSPEFSERVQSSGEMDKFGTVYAKIDLKDREIAEKLIALIEFRSNVVGEIHSLKNNRHIIVLYKIYIEGKSFSEIAEETNYNYDHVRRLHRNALKVFKRCPTMSDVDVIN